MARSLRPSEKNVPPLFDRCHESSSVPELSAVLYSTQACRDLQERNASKRAKTILAGFHLITVK